MLRSEERPQMLLVKNIGRLVTMEAGVITDAALFVKDGRIEWFGKEAELSSIDLGRKYKTVDAKGGVVLPGLIDAHTHLVHGGYRQGEFAARASGKTYQEIAALGGGIMSTVRATREASSEQLFKAARLRADEALQRGVTTMEVKSGYGLDTETELKILRVIKKMGENHPIEFVPTFLGAHTIPSEYKHRRKDYLRLVVEEMLPKVAEEGFAKYCDVFVEDVAFTVDEAREILLAGKKFGLAPRLHVDQLSCGGGAELAAEVGAVSADHLEYISDKGLSRLAEAGVVATLCPGSTFFMGQKGFAPAKKMLDAGVTVAIATDYNPGTCPCLDLFLCGTIAAAQMGLSLDDVLKGMTINAARSLGLGKTHGSVTRGKVADLIILDAPDEHFPFYRFGSSFVKMVIKGGKPLFTL